MDNNLTLEKRRRENAAGGSAQGLLQGKGRPHALQSSRDNCMLRLILPYLLYDL